MRPCISFCLTVHRIRNIYACTLICMNNVYIFSYMPGKGNLWRFGNLDIIGLNEFVLSMHLISNNNIHYEYLYVYIKFSVIFYFLLCTFHWVSCTLQWVIAECANGHYSWKNIRFFYLVNSLSRSDPHCNFKIPMLKISIDLSMTHMGLFTNYVYKTR